MISDQLKVLLNDIISNEIQLSVVMLDTMSDAHIIGYNGFKRFFRWMSRDRLEHAIRLKNKIVDFNDINPDVKMSYTTPTLQTNGSNMSIESFLNVTKSLSIAQIERLKAAAEMSIVDKEHMLMGILEHYIQDEECELNKINRILKRWTNAKKMGDASFLDRIDEDIHCKYKDKEKKRKYDY